MSSIKNTYSIKNISYWKIISSLNTNQILINEDVISLVKNLALYINQKYNLIN
jgi:hypothetical protein